VLVGAFKGKSKHIVKFLLHVAEDVRRQMAAAGIQSLGEVVGRRDLLEKKRGLEGKSEQFNLKSLLAVPPSDCLKRKVVVAPRLQHTSEIEAAHAALSGIKTSLKQDLGRDNRCLGVAAAGEIARANRDLGLTNSTLTLKHKGAAGHYYAAYSLPGMHFELDGVAADSCFTASYGGRLVVRPEKPGGDATLVGNTFGYGARGGEVYIAGRAGNRFGICLRRSHEGTGARIVVEGLEANGFQYMTGGTALVLGTVGRNLGSGMSGGTIYALNLSPSCLNQNYVAPSEVDDSDIEIIRALLKTHVELTGSKSARSILAGFNPTHFQRIRTKLLPEVYV
jgi:glutamate synthase domain-containing protein 3